MSDADGNPYTTGPTPRNEATLRRLYEDKGMTIAEIADELGYNDSTVRGWFDDFGIELRSSGRRSREVSE